MPAALTYLAIMLVVIVIWFLLLKRPVYEAVLISFIILLTITSTWGSVGGYIEKGLCTSLLYSMTAFCAMSILLTKTKVIDSAIAVILALLGRVTGGAGYVSVVASSFMGALSGSGPGNVMATGSITIPAMKKSGFPAELAANIESNASYLGNMIPPSGNITAALGALTGMAAYGEGYISQCLNDILNMFGRDNDYVVSGPVWEYFRAPKELMFEELPHYGIQDYLSRHEPIVNNEIDGLLREVILDKANGFVGRTVIHPTHVKFVNAMMAVTKEEYDDACQILGTGGGVVKGSGGNKMNEIKPHTNWAKKVYNRARAYGVIRDESGHVKLFAVND